VLLCSGALAKVALVLVCIFLLQPRGKAQPDEPSAAALFVAYRQGQFEEFDRQLARVRDWGALRRQISREAGAWPLEAKAAFLLDTADAALQQKAPALRTGPEVELFEDACKAARQLPAHGEFDGAWQAAALSVISARYASVISLGDHLKHNRGRLDEGRMALVGSMPGERIAWHEATQVQPALTGPARQEMWFAQRIRMGRAGMRDVLKSLEAASRYESVRAEATLRRAALLVVWEQHDEALPLLAAAETLSSDPWLRYMAALLSGRSLEATGRSADARLAYQSAVTLQENGKAARLALASIVFATGERDEADRLVGEALSQRVGPPDPWLEFLTGDFRFLEVRRAAMREHIR
jgi:tetratricopeptide (TPR) repeat protein